MRARSCLPLSLPVCLSLCLRVRVRVQLAAQMAADLRVEQMLSSDHQSQGSATASEIRILVTNTHARLPVAWCRVCGVALPDHLQILLNTSYMKIARTA